MSYLHRIFQRWYLFDFFFLESNFLELRHLTSEAIFNSEASETYDEDFYWKWFLVFFLDF